MLQSMNCTMCLQSAGPFKKASKCLQFKLIIIRHYMIKYTVGCERLRPLLKVFFFPITIHNISLTEKCPNISEYLSI